MFAVLALTSGFASLALSGCGSEPTPVPVPVPVPVPTPVPVPPPTPVPTPPAPGPLRPLTCGTIGSGTVAAANNPAYTCSNCGPSPCIGGNRVCYSCFSPVTQRCYQYRCPTSTGYTCQDVPCSSMCGTEGGGSVPAVNNPSYHCSNCGPNPCVATNHVCYSCYSRTGGCYKYSCNGGSWCSNTPCQFLSKSANETGALAWSLGDDALQSEPLDGGVPAWRVDSDADQGAIVVPV